MFIKSFISAAALVAAVAKAQIIDVPLGVTVDVGTEASCPADAPPGTDVDAQVLAVVTLNTVLDADLTLLGIGLVGATLDFDIDVCLCIDATVDVGLIELPVSADAGVIADVTDLVDDLQLGVTIPGVGTLSNLLNNGATEFTLNTSGESVQPCTCPDNATPICVNATCSCACNDDGAVYNPITQECVLGASGLTRRRVVRQFDSRQAKRSDIEARIAKK